MTRKREPLIPRTVGRPRKGDDTKGQIFRGISQRIGPNFAILSCNHKAIAKPNDMLIRCLLCEEEKKKNPTL
jgi:hypothetical protein